MYTSSFYGIFHVNMFVKVCKQLLLYFSCVYAFKGMHAFFFFLVIFHAFICERYARCFYSIFHVYVCKGVQAICVWFLFFFKPHVYILAELKVSCIPLEDATSTPDFVNCSWYSWQLMGSVVCQCFLNWSNDSYNTVRIIEDNQSFFFFFFQKWPAHKLNLLFQHTRFIKPRWLLLAMWPSGVK